VKAGPETETAGGRCETKRVKLKRNKVVVNCPTRGRIESECRKELKRDHLLLLETDGGRCELVSLKKKKKNFDVILTYFPSIPLRVRLILVDIQSNLDLTYLFSTADQFSLLS